MTDVVIPCVDALARLELLVRCHFVDGGICAFLARDRHVDVVSQPAVLRPSVHSILAYH